MPGRQHVNSSLPPKPASKHQRREGKGGGGSTRVLLALSVTPLNTRPWGDGLLFPQEERLPMAIRSVRVW